LLTGAPDGEKVLSALIEGASPEKDSLFSMNTRTSIEEKEIGHFGVIGGGEKPRKKKRRGRRSLDKRKKKEKQTSTT